MEFITYYTKEHFFFTNSRCQFSNCLLQCKTARLESPSVLFVDRPIVLTLLMILMLLSPVVVITGIVVSISKQV